MCAGAPLDDGGFVTTYMDITERRRSEAKIAHMALHDALTGLANRVLLNEQLEQALTRVKRGDMVAVHLLDLDHFKNVNDTLGHPAGDKLLKEAADRLRALVRETDTIARMGGDEFAILQVAINQPADATALAHRVIESVSGPYELDGRQVVIGTSVGIAIGPVDGLASDQLMRNADLALYRAKDDGRGTYRFFEPEMDAQMQERRGLEYDLRKALTAGEFELLLSACRQPRDQQDQRLRSAHPLAPSGKGPDLSRHLHPARRGDRLHRAAWRMGHQAGLHHRREVAGAHKNLGQPVARAVQESRLGAGRDERAGDFWRLG